MFEVVEVFRSWCKQKIGLHKQSVADVKLFKQREVWWCSVGMNVGDEIYGKGASFLRPVLVLKKITGNVFLALPMTSLEKKGTWYVEVKLHQKQNWVILSQARTLDARRLRNRIGELSDLEYLMVQKRFIVFLCL